MIAVNRCHDVVNNRRKLGGVGVTPIDLLNHHGVLLSVQFDCEGRATELRTKRMTLRRADFYVLCMMINTVENNDIFETANDKQLAIVHEAEIAGSQIRFRPIRCRGPECIVAGRTPITPCHVGTPDPDLADRLLVQLYPRHRINDGY